MRIGCLGLGPNPEADGLDDFGFLDVNRRIDVKQTLALGPLSKVSQRSQIVRCMCGVASLLMKP